MQTGPAASSSTGIDQVLAAMLRGEPLDVRAIKAFGAEALATAAVAHDVMPLIADRMAFAPAVPIDLRERFLEEAHHAAVLDLAVEAELRRLHVAFAERAIPLLLIKGSHLAYSHYSRPDLRARIDSDILVAKEQRDAADALFRTGLGYEAPPKLSGDFTATQKLYVKREHDTVVHMVDLHWRLASPQVFAQVLSFEELQAGSTPLPALGPAARGPSNVHALLIACMHRVAHHHDEADQFKWLFDIHLIASRFGRDEWNAFLQLVLAREVAAVCMDSLERSRHWFHTEVPPDVLGDPRLVGADSREETAGYLRERPWSHELLHNLRSLPRWSDRMRLVGEHLFPDAEYMRQVYAPASRLPLPLLYLVRMMRGMRGRRS